MAKNKHLHIYKRINIGRARPYLVYKCQRPLCSHYTNAELLIGNLALCPRCDNPYQIEKKHLTLVELHCNNCYVSRRKETNV